MRSSIGTPQRRILVIDDNPAIHQDFRKIFRSTHRSETVLAQSEAVLFGDLTEPAVRLECQLDSALQGHDGVALVHRARQANQPYGVAFVDMRMPPGWDGIETAARIWEQDPQVQIVICTAYSDYSWEEILQKLGHSDRLVILKKPFDNIEVLQIADALTQKWWLARQVNARLKDLERMVDGCARDPHTVDDQLHTTTQHQLAAATQRANVMLYAQVHRLRHHHALEEALRRALQIDALTVSYQPLVEIASRRAVGLEAFVEWHHPTLGTIAPDKFIPIAEESGLIVPLGEFVLRTVCAQIMRWEREHVPVVPVTVNVSAAQFERQPMRDMVRSILRETGMPPYQLALELTESNLMRDAPRYAKALHSLRSEGVRIQMDEFGTGYSSLSQLTQLPIDTLKIDRRLISRVATNSADEAIVSAILAMARSLGLRVVAEGVETAAQLQMLRMYGCKVAQGSYFSCALPADRCRELLLQLTNRSTFTDTLRSRLASASGGPAQLRIVHEQKTPGGDAQ